MYMKYLILLTDNYFTILELSLANIQIQQNWNMNFSTPFAKSNGRFFSDTKINMIPSSDLYDF